MGNLSIIDLRGKQPRTAATETQKRADRDGCCGETNEAAIHGCDGDTKKSRQGWLRRKHKKRETGMAEMEKHKKEVRDGR